MHFCKDTGLPLAVVPPRLKQFQGVDHLFLQDVQKVTSRGGTQPRVLSVIASRVLLCDPKGAIKRFLRHDQIKEVIVERAKAGQDKHQMGILVDGEFAIRLFIDARASPNIDEFVKVVRSVAMKQDRPPPHIAEGNVAKRVTQAMLKKDPRWQKPQEALRKRSPSPGARRPPPPPPQYPPQQYPPQQYPPQPPVVQPLVQQPEAAEPPAEEEQQQRAAEEQPQDAGEATPVMDDPVPGYHFGDTMDGVEPPVQDPSRRGSRVSVPDSRRESDHAAPQRHRKSVYEAPCVPAYAPPPPADPRVEFARCESAMLAAGEAPRPDSTYDSPGPASPTEMQRHVQAGQPQAVLKELADVLEHELAQMERRNAQLNQMLLHEKELRHSNELQLQQRIAALYQRIEQQQRIISLYDQRDALRGARSPLAPAQVRAGELPPGARSPCSASALHSPDLIAPLPPAHGADCWAGQRWPQAGRSPSGGSEAPPRSALTCSVSDPVWPARQPSQLPGPSPHQPGVGYGGGPCTASAAWRSATMPAQQLHGQGRERIRTPHLA